MSITFSCEDTPTEKITPYPDEPDYEVDVPVAPFIEINLSNSNAFDILSVLQPDVEPDHCGRWTKEDLIKIQGRLITLLAVGQDQLIKPNVQEGNFFEMGRCSVYVRDRLNQFMTLVAVAIQMERDVVYG